jgi:hypothetical protein
LSDDRHLPQLIEDAQVGLVAALRLSRVGQFDHQIDIGAEVVTASVGHRVARDRRCGADRAGPATRGPAERRRRRVRSAFGLEGRDLAPVAGRVGIGDVFRHMLQALRLASHAACRDAEG